MHELSRTMGNAGYAITDKVYAHVRPRDFSSHRAAFCSHLGFQRARCPRGYYRRLSVRASR